MQAFAEAQALMPAESWLELRYEDVVERPREQVQRLLDHLGLEWTERFERSFAALEFATDRPAPEPVPGRAGRPAAGAGAGGRGTAPDRQRRRIHHRRVGDLGRRHGGRGRRGPGQPTGHPALGRAARAAAVAAWAGALELRLDPLGGVAAERPR